MRRLRCLFALILLLLIFKEAEMVSAMNTGFSTESLLEEDTNTFLSNVNISVLTEEPQKKTIKVFDINDDGRVAIGYNTSGRKSIGVYTSDSTFQYAYEFNCSGDFGVEWDNNSLIIYFVRSNIAITIDSEGEIESALRIQDTIENNYYWRNSVFITERIHGDTKYTLENDMGLLNVFASSYSQLVVTKNNGEKMIFYDVNNSELLRMLAEFIAIIVFVCIVIFIVLRRFSKKSISTEGSSVLTPGTVNVKISFRAFRPRLCGMLCSMGHSVTLI